MTHIWYLPHLLSLSRPFGALLLLVVYRPDDPTRASISAGLVALMILSDVLDGWVARRLGIASKFGYVLDGLCDRVLHVSVYLLLLEANIISEYLAWLLMSRELCYYSVRILQPNWHNTKNRVDRIITVTFTMTVRVCVMIELFRSALFLFRFSSYTTPVLNWLLAVAVAVSFMRMVPQMYQVARPSGKV